MTGRREAALTFLGALLAAVLLLWAVGESWASARGSSAGGLLVLTRHVSGRSAAPVVAAAGIVALAGAAAIPATRRLGRIVAGVLLICTGLAAVVESMLRRASARDDVRRALPARDAVQVHGTPWPWVALFGAVLLVVLGCVLVIRGPRWAALSRRYEAPSAGVRPDAVGAVDEPAGSATDAVTWDALDRGEDPTEGVATPVDSDPQR